MNWIIIEMLFIEMIMKWLQDLPYNHKQQTANNTYMFIDIIRVLPANPYMIPQYRLTWSLVAVYTLFIGCLEDNGGIVEDAKY